MAANHPLAPAILPFCQQFPAQAGALFQSFLDLNLAQAWKDVEPIALEECECAVLRGIPKLKKTHAFVLPMGLSTPTSLGELTKVFAAIDSRYPFPVATKPTDLAGATPDVEAPTLYLSIVEKDSSVVYYVLRRGIVSPKEVPE